MSVIILLFVFILCNEKNCLWISPGCLGKEMVWCKKEKWKNLECLGFKCQSRIKLYQLYIQYIGYKSICDISLDCNYDLWLHCFNVLSFYFIVFDCLDHPTRAVPEAIIVFNVGQYIAKCETKCVMTWRICREQLKWQSVEWRPLLNDTIKWNEIKWNVLCF